MMAKSSSEFLDTGERSSNDDEADEVESSNSSSTTPEEKVGIESSDEITCLTAAHAMDDNLPKDSIRDQLVPLSRAIPSIRRVRKSKSNNIGGGVRFRGVYEDDPNRRTAWESAACSTPPLLCSRQSTEEDTFMMVLELSRKEFAASQQLEQAKPGMLRAVTTPIPATSSQTKRTRSAKESQPKGVLRNKGETAVNISMEKDTSHSESSSAPPQTRLVARTSSMPSMTLFRKESDSAHTRMRWDDQSHPQTINNGVPLQMPRRQMSSVPGSTGNNDPTSGRSSRRGDSSPVPPSRIKRQMGPASEGGNDMNEDDIEEEDEASDQVSIHDDPPKKDPSIQNSRMVSVVANLSSVQIQKTSEKTSLLDDDDDDLQHELQTQIMQAYLSKPKSMHSSNSSSATSPHLRSLLPMPSPARSNSPHHVELRVLPIRPTRRPSLEARKGVSSLQEAPLSPIYQKDDSPDAFLMKDYRSKSPPRFKDLSVRQTNSQTRSGYRAMRRSASLRDPSGQYDLRLRKPASTVSEETTSSLSPAHSKSSSGSSGRRLKRLNHSLTDVSSEGLTAYNNRRRPQDRARDVVRNDASPSLSPQSAERVGSRGDVAHGSDRWKKFGDKKASPRRDRQAPLPSRSTDGNFGMSVTGTRKKFGGKKASPRRDRQAPLPSRSTDGNFGMSVTGTQPSSQSSSQSLTLPVDTFSDDSLALKSVVRAARRRKEPKTYLKKLDVGRLRPYEDSAEFRNYCLAFQLSQWEPEIQIALAMHPETLALQYQTLVPSQVSSRAFWFRYFWRCDEKRVLLEFRRKKEEAGEKLVNHQSSTSLLQTSDSSLATPKSDPTGATDEDFSLSPVAPTLEGSSVSEGLEPSSLKRIMSLDGIELLETKNLSH